MSHRRPLANPDPHKRPSVSRRGEDAIAASGGTIAVHVPMAFHRKGGRRTVTAPDGTRLIPAFGRPSPNQALIKALARAFRWRRLIETGTYATIQDLATAERVNPSYAARVLRLTLLAPTIVEAILDGRSEVRCSLDAVMKPFAVDWAAQRKRFDAPVSSV